MSQSRGLYITLVVIVMNTEHSLIPPMSLSQIENLSFSYIPSCMDTHVSVLQILLKNMNVAW